MQPFASPAGKTWQMRADRLTIPEHLYGRESEIATLLAAFDRVTVGQRPTLVFVSGYSGTGKSSLVDELRKAIVPRGGLYAAGKFDQYKRDIPYSTLAQALQALVGRLLGKDESELGEWRTALRTALGPNGRLMVDLVPQLGNIIGEQRSVPELPPHDSAARFEAAFRRFLGVFAKPGRPLAIFLDDLQWLDRATLDLVLRLVIEPDAQPLLLIAAYRNNDLAPSHPLVHALERLRESGASVESIVLSALTVDDITSLLVDAMRTSWSVARPLAELIFEKTAGNPFFVKTFIATLFGSGLIAFDNTSAQWAIMLDRIRIKGFSDNVVDFMVAKLTQLPSAARLTLSQMACLGSSAKHATLAMVVGLPEEQLQQALSDAVKEGLIVRQGESWAFTHDRVQEAAYAGIPERDRPQAHLRIGTLLADHTAQSGIEHIIFEIVSQLNQGAPLMTSPEERNRLAQLNLFAGRRAKGSTAYASALVYLDAGRAMLGADCWTCNYRVAFDLELNRAECEFLTGSAITAQERLLSLTARAQGLSDSAAATRLRMLIFTTMGRPERAIDIGLECLSPVALNWTRDPTAAEIVEEFDRMRGLIGDRSIEDLLHLPLMVNADWQATMDLLADLVPTAMVSSHPNLAELALLRMATLSVEHGHCDASAYCFASLGIVLGSRFADYRSGLRFGLLGCDLVEKRGLERFKTGTFANFGIFIVPWTEPMEVGHAMIRRGFDTALASGNVAYTVYCSNSLIGQLLLFGTPLEEAHRQAVLSLALARKAGYELFALCSLGELRLIQDLRGMTQDEVFRGDAQRDVDAFEQALDSGGPGTAFSALICWVRRMQRCFFAGDHLNGIKAAKKAGEKMNAAPYMPLACEYHFYAALLRAAPIDRASPSECTEHTEALRLHQRQIDVWAECCPENFGNRAFLVAAEIARTEGRQMDAQHLYERAIQSARVNGFVQNEAIAFELASRFFKAQGYGLISDAYIQQAHTLYVRWGAHGKAAQLEESHPALRGVPAEDTASEIATRKLDHEAMIKLASAMSTEIVFERLVDKLMTIAVERTGAGRGLLILQGKETLQIVAEANAKPERVEVTLLQEVVSPAQLAQSVLNYVLKTNCHAVIADDAMGTAFSDDEYLRVQGPRSVLCVPILRNGRLTGALYLENSLVPNVFSTGRIALLDLLASQAAASLDNARLYAELEQENMERERVEEKLRRSEAFLATAQRLSRTGSCWWKVSTGQIVWSEEGYRLLGYSLDTVPSLDLIAKRCHPDDVERLLGVLAHAGETGTDFELRHRLLMEDGTIKQVHVKAQCIRSIDGHTEYIAAISDVTEQEATHSELERALEHVRSSEARLQTIIAGLPTMAWAARADGHVEFFSQRWLDYTGLTTETAQGSGWAVVIHPADAAMLEGVWTETVASKLPREVEGRLRRFDGEYRWFLIRTEPVMDLHGNVTNWYGTNTDIEDRRRAEDALRRARV